MRQTPAEIDRAILDVAARIFAIHGFSHTSVQQIADAVGYSKPGLLHRFGSKEALHRAVVAEVSHTVHQITERALSLGHDPDLVPQVLELLSVRALKRPGMMYFMLRAFEPASNEPGIETIQAAGYRLLDVLDRPVSSPASRLRVALALKLIVDAALTQHSSMHRDMHVETESLVPLLVSLASHVMGVRLSVPS